MLTTHKNFYSFHIYLKNSRIIACNNFFIKIFSITRQLIYLILLTFLAAGNLFSQEVIEKFYRISIEDGLSQNTVVSILQDSKGFMWFGTIDGLNKYDGYRFYIYKQDPDDSRSLSHNRVYAMVEDSLGNLWIGTNGGGLNLFNRKKQCFQRIQNNPDDPNSLSSDRIYDVLKDREGNIWIGTNGGGLNLLNQKTHSFKHYKHEEGNPGSLSDNWIEDIYQDMRGNLWIGTNSCGLNLFDKENERFIHYKYQNDNPNSLSDNEVRTISEDYLGNLWIGTYGGGLTKMVQDGKSSYQFVTYKNNPKNLNSLSDDRVSRIFEDSNNTLWVGTDGGGLNKYDRNSDCFIHYHNDVKNPYSLSSDRIYSMSQDRSGSLWIGTWIGGANRCEISPKKFLHFCNDPENQNSLSDNAVYDIYEDENDIFWIGTLGGLNKFDINSKRFTIYKNDPGKKNSISGNRIWCVYGEHEINGKSLWIGTENGLNQYNYKNDNFTCYKNDVNSPNSLSHNQIYSICRDHNGYLWVGTEDGLNRIDIKSNQTKRYYNDSSDPYSISNNRIVFLFEDTEKILWIGTSNGLNRYDPIHDRFISYKNDPQNPKSLSNSNVTRIYENDDKKLWIATHNGLNLFDRKSENFTRYTDKDGLPKSAIYGVVKDDQGNLWLASNKGLAKFNPETREVKIYDATDGLQSCEFNTACCKREKTGELFFGGINGFNIFYPDNIKDNSYLPPIEILDFQVFNKSVPIEEDDSAILKQSITETEKIILSYEHQVFSFEFAALNYAFPKKNNYAYKMEGLEDEWNFVGNRRFATYTNLQPGDYTFRVKGSNNDDVWNEEGTSIEITILPPFWQTTLFRVSCGIIILLIIFGIYQLRTLNIRRSHKGLKKINENLNKQIAERKIAEAALRDSEEKYRTLIEQSNDAIYLLFENKFEMINERFTEMFGYSIKDTKKDKFNFMKLVAPESASVIEDHNHRSLNGKKLEPIHEFSATTKEGKKIECEASVSYIDYKGQKAIQGVIRDITSRKNVERQLSRLASVVEQAGEAIFITDLTGKIEYVNPAYNALTGYTLEEAQTVILEMLKEEVPENEFVGHLKRTIETGETWKGTCLNSKRDSTQYHEDSMIFPIKDKSGNIINYAAVKRDITGEKKLEAQLIQAQKMDAIGQLAGGIAHDFNNILTAINGYAELGLKKIDEDSPVYKNLNVILSAGENASTLVRQLLGFSRKQVIEPKIIDINKLITNLDKMLRRLIGEDISMETDLVEDLNLIKADPGQLEQILINIIVNARDAINQKTIIASEKMITVETCNVYLDEIYKSNHPNSQEGWYVNISISDTGIGMNEDTMRKIFEPFFTTKEKEKGTGLGLATVYGIIKQNNGSIYVYSEPGKGSTMKIYWPSIERENVVEYTSEIISDIEGGSETILIVEDNEEVRSFTFATLQSLGYKVIEASNGQNALDYIAQNNPKLDLLISDVVMPKMGGKELAEKLLSIIPKLKILYASGYTDNHIVHCGALEEGINFIHKPFSIKGLALKVREVLDS